MIQTANNLDSRHAASIAGFVHVAAAPMVPWVTGQMRLFVLDFFCFSSLTFSIWFSNARRLCRVLLGHLRHFPQSK
jgi:hypothetical protein